MLPERSLLSLKLTAWLHLPMMMPDYLVKPGDALGWEGLIQ
jgi:hypothetical protein